VPSALDFQKALEHIFESAETKGAQRVDVVARDLHHQVGSYPGPSHRMPTCCGVMRRNIMEGDTILAEPRKGKGASLAIRYRLPRRDTKRDEAKQKITARNLLDRSGSAAFEILARSILSQYFGASLVKGRVPNVPKEFDMISPDGKIVGDAKYLTMVRGKYTPPAKFSVIAEHVWLLEKTHATNKFLVFGNDSRVPREWLKKYGHLAAGVSFLFIDERSKRVERLR